MPFIRFMQRTFYSLENPRYRIMWFGTLFSFLGMQMQVLARGYLAFDLTGRNSALGGVMLAFGLPQLVLSMWGGVLADRLPKRKVLWVAQGVIALNSAWLATMIEMGMVQYWMLVVAGVVQGSGFAFVGPARQAFISELVGKDRIGNAVVLQQLSMNSTRVIGPSIAGALIGIHFIGVAGVYYLTTLGFVIASLTLLKLPKGEPKRKSGRSPVADLLDGFRYVKGRPAVSQLILVAFAVMMLGFPYQSFLPALAKEQYGVGASGLGLLSSVAAIGAVTATIFVAAFAQHQKAWFAQPVLAAMFALSLIGLGFAPNFPMGLVAILFVGALASAFQSLNNSLTMMLTEQEYHGRVQSISSMSFSLFGVAALPIGFVADHIGLQETLTLMGSAAVICIALLQIVARLQHAADDRLAKPVALEAAAGGQ